MIKDSLQVAGANGAAVTIFFSHINEALTTISLLTAIAFTLYKFYKEQKKQ